MYPHVYYDDEFNIVTGYFTNGLLNGPMKVRYSDYSGVSYEIRCSYNNNVLSGIMKIEYICDYKKYTLDASIHENDIIEYDLKYTDTDSDCDDKLLENIYLLFGDD